MECDKKMQESLDTFIRQTMGCKQYMSFSSRSGDNPLQRIIEHQQAMENCVKNLKIDIDICNGIEKNANAEPHQIDIEKNSSCTKGGDSLEKRAQDDQNLQTIKSNVPQTVVALTTTTTKNLDLPSRPLLSPSKVQWQKCEKCSCEFFSPLNLKRHTRTHLRRVNQVDKEDLVQKKKNVATFWDKLNHDEMQQILTKSRKEDVEDLSRDIVVNGLIIFTRQNNQIALPPSYVKAGQNLLDMLHKDKKSSLSSKQLFVILDEASEKTFLCSQGDVSKIGLEEKNLVASLGYIVEQTLVKAWMVDKDAEALRNQQELFKEMDVAQMKREKIVARKKKKKGKSRQKGLKERKFNAIQTNLNEENESIDGENHLPEIVEEDNSPTNSSTSRNSSRLENQFLEHPEMEVYTLIQNNNMENHKNDGENGLQKSRDLLSIHVTSKEVVSDSIDEDQLKQNRGEIFSSHEEKEQYFKSHFHQVKIEDQGRYGHTLEQDQRGVDCHQHTLAKPSNEFLRLSNQDLYQKKNWASNIRFQEGIQQNSYKQLQKTIGTPCSSNIERSNSPTPRFYRGKAMNLRGVVPFLTTQQWTKKTHIPASSKFINDVHNDENSLGHNTRKGNLKHSSLEHTLLVHEMDVNTNINSRIEKEEFRTFEKKDFLQATMPSLPKVVANIGSMPTTSFNLNVNSEDWPPLSNTRATYYPKSSQKCPLDSNQYEVNSRPIEKLIIDNGGGYQTRLEPEIEGSLNSVIPLTKGPTNHTSNKLMTMSRQKGIVIGSVRIPLGDYIHLSKPWLGPIGKRINTPQQVNQSYTYVLAAPPVQYAQDPMANKAGQQKTHEESNRSRFEDSSNEQVMDSYGGSSHYRPSSLRSTTSVNFNVRHIRSPSFERIHTYPLGDREERGILLKQPLWPRAPMRSQKVWRQIRSTIENVNPNAISGTNNIESNPVDNNKKEYTKLIKSGENVNATSKSKGIQVSEIDFNTIEQYTTLTINARSQFEDDNGVLDIRSMKEHTFNSITNLDINSLVQKIDHCQNKTNQITAMTKIKNEKSYQLEKCNVIVQNMTCNDIQNKNLNTISVDEKAHWETSFNHLAWIQEAIEFHMNRWHLSLKDPETILSKCEVEHLELQTSIWIDFMNNLPSIATRLKIRKEDVSNPTLGVIIGTDDIIAKNSMNLSNELESQNIENNSHDGSVAGVWTHPTSKESQDVLSTCRSGSPIGIGSTIEEFATWTSNHDTNNNEGQVGSRCGSSCSDNSMSSNNRSERRDRTCTMNTTRERP